MQEWLNNWHILPFNDRNDGSVYAVNDLLFKHSPSADTAKLRENVYSSVTIDFKSNDGHFKSRLHSDCGGLIINTIQRESIQRLEWNTLKNVFLGDMQIAAAPVA